MTAEQKGPFTDSSWQPKVSVVIPVYNGESDLPDLINCLRSQTYPGNQVEYLLVDNASHDLTSTLLQTAAQEASAQGLTLRPLQEQQIQSSYAARNTGIRAATGEILAFTDADCRPQPDWLNNLIQPFTEATIGIVAGEIAALPGKTLLEQYADQQATLSQKYTLAHPFYPYGQTANLAVRRQVLEQVGLFRPYLTTGGDADLCWRVQQQTDWQLYFAVEAIVQHRHRPTWQALRQQWYRYGRSNKYLHELHGVPLTRDLTRRDYLYRCSRWLLKELPIASIKAIVGKATFLDLIDTPINLFCTQARSAGQRETQLLPIARQVEWLNQMGKTIAVDS